jgi:hypothetical protein
MQGAVAAEAAPTKSIKARSNSKKQQQEATARSNSKKQGNSNSFR